MELKISAVVQKFNRSNGPHTPIAQQPLEVEHVTIDDDMLTEMVAHHLEEHYGGVVLVSSLTVDSINP